MTRIETEKNSNGSWTAWCCTNQQLVACGGGPTEYEAIQAAKRAHAIDLAEARREQDEEAELFDE